MKVDMVADKKVDMVNDMKVDKVADMKVDIVPPVFPFIAHTYKVKKLGNHKELLSY